MEEAIRPLIYNHWVVRYGGPAACRNSTPTSSGVRRAAGRRPCDDRAVPARPPTPQPSAWRRRRLRVWALGLTPALALAVVGAVQLGRGLLARDAADSPPGPVVLVSGYGGSTTALRALGDRLRAADRRTVLVPPVGDNTGDLSEQARALDTVVRAQLAAGAASVDVIGYSAGGVVTRVWAARLGGAQVARRIVTLGSPHHGTDAAQLAAGVLGSGCPTACHQLAPSGDLLRDLPDAPSGPRWTSLWTATDELVSPPDSARLKGAVDVELQAVCPGRQVSHGRLPTDPVAVGLVLRALGDPGLTGAPPTSQCGALAASGA